MDLLIANPLTSIASLSGALLVAVLAGVVFIEETGVPVPFAPGDVLLMIAGIAIASDTVEPVAMIGALFVATVLGALLGREVFAAVGRPALVKVADALRFRPALERATHLLRRGGAPAVFVGRLTPGLRIHTTQVAGVSNMSRLTFAAGLIPSVVVYLAIFVGLGALVGRPAIGLFHRAEHRLFVVAVTGLLLLAVVLSIRWLARRGALTALEPIVTGVRRDLADAIELAVFRGSDQSRVWRTYPLVRRLWAGLIDAVIVVAIAVLILTAISGAGPSEVELDLEAFLLLAGVALGYRVPYEARTGQTLGKTMMGISVYGPDEAGPGWWRAAVRNVVGIIFPLWPIDAVLVLRTQRRQRLGDLLTQTTVRRVAR
ncbi:MAG TPA: RDD family protein [Candidatus Angelobacter sp.]|jgi:membrane-associated protein|nr:RDD family protein [Candidatus Angelobacter sp.]